jgi:AAHS family 4-hydroxybenzoate transporter-like MFS transporter
MQRPTDANVTEIIDRCALSFVQIMTALLCGIVAVLDGFDNFAIALVAPAVAQELHISMPAFGAVFGINSLGMMLGALVFGPMGDRRGRKPLILASVLVIGVATLLTPFVSSFPALLAVRFIVGLGAGGVMPNIVALTSEYAPQRIRATLVTFMFAGIPVGTILAGLIIQLMDGYGWRGVFYVGGALPFLLLPLLAGALPESIRYMITRGVAPERPLAVLRRIDPATAYPAGTRCTLPDEVRGAGISVARLFQGGRGLATPMLWAIFFCNLLVWFFLMNWLPSVLQRADYPRAFAVVATMILYGGGIAGGLVFSRLVDRKMSYGLLIVGYTAAALCMAGVAFATTFLPTALLPAVFGAGFFVGGCQYCIVALAANLYPTDVRSTGLGWALGLGRIGAIIGPMIGGALIGLQWSLGQLFLIAAVPALLAALAALALDRSGKTLATRTAQAEAAACSTPPTTSSSIEAGLFVGTSPRQ